MRNSAANDPGRKCFLDLPPDTPFPVQNLPFGVFRPAADEPARVGVAIGDLVLDLAALEADGLLPRLAAEPVFAKPALNDFLALGRTAWRLVRLQVSDLLCGLAPRLQADAALRARALHPQRTVLMELPAAVGDYTDFYSSREHATNVGTMLRGAADALQPNWLHLPVAYHGRSSSLVPSGTDVVRPSGQTRAEGQDLPRFGPSKAVDFELEVGALVGVGNPLGTPIPVADALDHVFGLVLVNDWSARDLQKWEYVPLGPFLAKNFATTVSPWVVTLDALEPFRVAGPVQDPPPLPHLASAGPASYDIHLEAWVGPEGGPRTRVTDTNFRHLYWSLAQQVAHHTSNGCNLRPGDLLASGTVSGPEPEARGCLLERTWGGKEPLTLKDGEPLVFLRDGDTVRLTGWAQADGYRIGFGDAVGRLLPAR